MPRSAHQVGGDLQSPTLRTPDVVGAMTADYAVLDYAGGHAITATGAVALTIAQLEQGVVDVDPGGSARNLSFPVATEIIGSSVLGLDEDNKVAGPFFVRNTADADEGLTPVTSTGNTVNNVAAFSQNTTAAFYVRRLSSTTCLITQH